MKRCMIAVTCVLFFAGFAGLCSAKEADNAKKQYVPKDDYAPGEVLVILSADVNQNEKLDAAENLNGVEASINGTIVERIKASRGKEIAVVKLQKGRTVKQALAENWTKKDSRILHVEPNWRLYADAVPNDPMFSQLWGMNNTGQTGGLSDADIDAPEAWNVTTGSSSVIVAVIDTGVDYLHPDLQANMWVNPGEVAGNGVDDDGNGFIDDIYGYDFVQNDSDPSDAAGHGTHCAGTIAAVGNNNIGVAGVCWQAKIMACRFLDASGSGYTDDAVQAVYYAVDNGASILSNSWGGGGYSEVLKVAIEYARDHNVLFVAAAGNAGSDNDVTPHYPSSYDVSNVVAVANTTSSDQPSSSSCYGLHSVDLGAPGSSILSSVPPLTNLFFEDFEGASVPGFAGTQMLTGGTNTWVTIDSAVYTPNKAALTDAATYPYSAFSDSWLMTPPLDTRGLRGLSVSFTFQLETPSNDPLTVDVWDGAAWQPLTSFYGSAMYGFYWSYTIDIPEQYRSAAMQIRFRWTTDATDNNYYGFELDNIAIQYIGSNYSGAYANYSGTSMATPHVSGAAALVRTLYPAITLNELKARLMMGDPIAALAGKTVSGRRLNAYSALTASGLMVTYPNGGESLLRGYPCTINWASVGGSPYVNIYWFRGEYAEFDIIAESVENTGSYVWNIPTGIAMSNDYKIYIEDLGSGLFDESDNFFEIRDPMPYWTELFGPSPDTFDLDNKSVLFTPAGSGYTACIQTASSLPTDPAGGISLSLGDDSYATVSLPFSVPFYGTNYGTIYVGSNGYITFDSGDTTYSETIVNHFSHKRVAALFDDLYSGSVSWKSETDHIAVTWNNVSEFSPSNANTFQIELFTDGRIRITWLAIAALDGLAGLSNGTAAGSDFAEEDFSALQDCGVQPPVNPAIIYRQDFEQGMDGFFIDNMYGAGNGLWHLSTACNSGLAGHTTPSALYYGSDVSCDYNNGLLNQGVVTSPVIDLTSFAAGPITLQVKYFLQTEQTAGWDKATIEAAQDGGAFVELAHNSRGAPVPLVDGSGSWQQVELDLSAYAGSTIELRFGFNTGDAFENAFGGFYVDDITIEGPYCPYSLVGDLNADCAVDLADLALLSEHWLANCYVFNADPACVLK